jgi:hypothetical protein
MIKKKILFVGCSFTADSGFTEHNAIRYHWPWLLSRHYDFYFYNAGIGASSNEEIFYRTIELTADQNFDLVVIMWTSLGRKWAYFSEPNIDEYTMISPTLGGWKSDSYEAELFHKIYLTCFNNRYISLKQWLDQIICIQGYLANKNQPYVFIKGFDNFVSDFNNIQCHQNGFDNVSDFVKKVLDFDNNPDHRLHNKISEIQRLIQKVNTEHWADFINFDTYNRIVDLADDNYHPGPITNQLICQALIDHINHRKLLG